VALAIINRLQADFLKISHDAVVAGFTSYWAKSNVSNFVPVK